MIRRNSHAGGGNGAKGWCERRGLNSQGLLRWILNPVRMPVSPLSHERAIYCKTMNLTQLCAVGKRKSARPGPAARRFCASERRWGSPSAQPCGSSFPCGREGGFSGLEAREKSLPFCAGERPAAGRFFRGIGVAALRLSCATRRDGAKGRKRDVRRSGKNPAPSGALRPAAPGRL